MTEISSILIENKRKGAEQIVLWNTILLIHKATAFN